jgi:hypothetical protein
MTCVQAGAGGLSIVFVSIWAIQEVFITTK